MKYIAIAVFLLVGCESPEQTVKNAYASLCERQPESMSCVKHENTGYAANFQSVSNVSHELYSNFTYSTDTQQYNTEEYWFDNKLVSIPLKGDCDDISLTFISQLILDGVKPSTIRFIASGENGTLRHYYVRVKLDNGEYFNFYKIDKYTDIMYMQYDNIGVFQK